MFFSYAFGDRFDLNYVGCERQNGVDVCTFLSRLIWTMWDVNPKQSKSRHNRRKKFDLNYVGCEQAVARLKRMVLNRVWSELCGMWTWSRANGLCLLGKVWSELCGMWTSSWTFLARCVNSVWSELCGMWTLASVFRITMFVARLIWTMWDVNQVSFWRSKPRNHVWSELCGMWTCL